MGVVIEKKRPLWIQILLALGGLALSGVLNVGLIFLLVFLGLALSFIWVLPVALFVGQDPVAFWKAGS